MTVKYDRGFIAVDALTLQPITVRIDRVEDEKGKDSFSIETLEGAYPTVKEFEAAYEANKIRQEKHWNFFSLNRDGIDELMKALIDRSKNT